MTGELCTPRLRLRHWRPDDLDDVVVLFAKPEVWRYPFGRGLTAEEAEAYLARRLATQDDPGTSPAAAEDRATGALIGYIGLGPTHWIPELMPAVEIGWRLDPGYWGRGLATEGARAVLAHGFVDMGLTEVVSVYEPDNVASGRVMTNVGIPFERATRHPTIDVPLHIHRLTRGQWLEQQAVHRD